MPCATVAEEVAYLGTDNQAFPDVSCALSKPNGLLAFGGDLSESRLITAYELGIFPWFDSDDYYVHWWSPDPRAVLFPNDLHVSRSLTKLLRQNRYRVKFDTDFSQVIQQCAKPREPNSGTWITAAMQQAYENLFRAGIAHSVEVWDRNGQLAGGLYGVSLGRMFFGESMFSAQKNASKIAIVALLRHLEEIRFNCLDCQMMTPHLASLGAKNISRAEFVKMLEKSNRHKSITGPW